MCSDVTCVLCTLWLLLLLWLLLILLLKEEQEQVWLLTREHSLLLHLQEHKCTVKAVSSLCTVEH